jgi:hypothetical protein
MFAKIMLIHFFGYTIYEPVTVLTDVLLGLFCLLLSAKLKRDNNLWWIFFIAVGLSNFLGAVGHGLYAEKDNIVQLFARLFGIISVLAAGLATLTRFTKGRKRSTAKALVLVNYFVFTIWLLSNNTFAHVKWNATLGLGIFVAFSYLYMYFKSKNSKELLVTMGIFILAMAAGVHSIEFSAGEFFNYNDISHVIMFFGMFTIYKGVLANEKTQPAFATS